MRPLITIRTFCLIALCLALGSLAGVLASGGIDDHHHGALRQASIAQDMAAAAVPTAVPGGPGYVMLAASDFKTDTNQDAFFRYYNGNTIEPASGSSGIGISAAIHLPQGAQITKVTAFYYDSDPASAPLIDLYRGITNTMEIVGGLSAALPDNAFASGEDTRSVAVSGPAAVVDNSRYSYMVIVTLNRDTTTPAHTQQLHSVRVDYAFSTSLPTISR